jgi:hypothetical protein
VTKEDAIDIPPVISVHSVMARRRIEGESGVPSLNPLTKSPWNRIFDRDQSRPSTRHMADTHMETVSSLVPVRERQLTLSNPRDLFNVVPSFDERGRDPVPTLWTRRILRMEHHMRFVILASDSRGSDED